MKDSLHKIYCISMFTAGKAVIVLSRVISARINQKGRSFIVMERAQRKLARSGLAPERHP
ncbi:hypothetical protein O164_14105 [Pseudomonas taiwanensis SJ9]|uniref:Uncharacterized protein n=1 Tax=Pseudomonas taiwanensis SJ9 TaxID=1388762 RepID=V7DBK5_9PSED|nr:hypothetical protein O164_14105 [Pseudomonas taiwanensis SJ9]